MLDPDEIYVIDPIVAAEVDARTVGVGPVLIHAVRGVVDAGRAGQLAAAHLTGTYDPVRLVTFDTDQLVDYRSRRPVVTYDANRWSNYEQPELVVDLLRDSVDVPFLLLHGVEPDVQWERYAAAVRQIVERFNVSLAIGIHGIPMGIPHTRPLTVTAHATRPELVGEHPSWFGAVQIPSDASTLLEIRLGESGHDALGFAVHVPHYLSQSAYPQAGVLALEQVEHASGLELDLSGLAAAAEGATAEVERQVSESTDVADVVRALEQQYDAFSRSRGRTNLLADTAQIPTADELGAEFERFLAEQDGESRR